MAYTDDDAETRRWFWASKGLNDTCVAMVVGYERKLDEQRTALEDARHYVSCGVHSMCAESVDDPEDIVPGHCATCSLLEKIDKALSGSE